MFDVSLFILILLFLTPIVLVLFAHGYTGVNQRRLSLTAVILQMVGLVVLLFEGEVEIMTSVAFLGEPITFSITNSAIILYMVVLVILGNKILWDQEGEHAVMTAYQWALVNLSLSFGFIAFISGQFMIRYITLDIVGLLAALTVLSTFTATTGMRHFILIFQILRLGDLSLLAAILLANHITGTLEISQMIAAAVDMRPDARMWVFLGFLLALLIKLGVWPFGIWLERARHSAPRISFWISGLLLPGLGYYLLYRIVPVINSGVIYQNITVITALSLAVIMILVTALHEIRFERFVDYGSVMSCFVLAVAAYAGGTSSGGQGVEYFFLYIIGVIIHRWLLLLVGESSKRPDRVTEHSGSPLLKRNTPRGLGLQVLTVVTLLFPVLLNYVFLGINWRVLPAGFSIGWAVLTIIVFVWDVFLQRDPVMGKVLKNINPDDDFDEAQHQGILLRLAGQINRTLESGILTDGVVQLTELLSRFADWIYEYVEMGLERLFTRIGKKILAISEGTMQRVEVEPSKKAGGLINGSLKAIETYETKFKRKPLRWDLAWIPFLLVVILIILFVL